MLNTVGRAYWERVMPEAVAAHDRNAKRHGIIDGPRVRNKVRERATI